MSPQLFFSQNIYYIYREDLLKNLSLQMYTTASVSLRHIHNRDSPSVWQVEQCVLQKYTNGGGGHLGCSSSFNFNIYKESLEKEWGHTFNSQGREQSHALLDKCTASLRQKQYPNFMKWLACFFACRNLINMGEL